MGQPHGVFRTVGDGQFRFRLEFWQYPAIALDARIAEVVGLEQFRRY